MARLKVAEVTPTIVSLQEQLEQIRAGEIEKVRRRFGPLTPQQEEALEALTRGIINKIAHGPISELRSHAGKPEGAHVIAAIRKVFHLTGLIHARHRIPGSQLALWQARWVEAAARRLLGRECRIEIIKTTGDKITDVPLAKVGTKGLFTKEIEEALLDGRADLAVHSLKDLPTDCPKAWCWPRFRSAKTRATPSSAARSPNLPHGAKVGTSSLRRAAQLRKLRPDLAIESVRGNLDTRLRKLDEGQYDAIVLAAAGLKRLGWGDRIAEILTPIGCVPPSDRARWPSKRAPTARASTRRSARITRTTHAAVTAERGVLGALGGGCQVPIGAYATVADDRLLHRMRDRGLARRRASMIRGEARRRWPTRSRGKSAAALGARPAGRAARAGRYPATARA